MAHKAHKLKQNLSGDCLGEGAGVSGKYLCAEFVCAFSGPYFLEMLIFFFFVSCFFLSYQQKKR